MYTVIAVCLMDVMFWCRNESYQEELWRRSIDMVRDFLSASTLATYGQSQLSTVSPSDDVVAPAPIHAEAEVRQWRY